ncbi:MAG: hypothetical protein ABSC22_10430 [Roseiarcus sp.]|jgi:hypothetical protein
MYAAIRAAAALIRRGAETSNTDSAPRALGVKALSARIALSALLCGFGLTAPALDNPAAAQSSGGPVIVDGEAAVSGFSGASAMTPTPQGVDPVAVTFIDPNGPSARVVDLRNAGGPPQAQVLPAPKPFTVTAAQVGQVFAVALDKAVPPNIYLAASSAYGLPIVLPASEAGKPPQRLADGAPGAAFMSGLFGPAAMQGGPGSIWRIDGASGAVSLFANVTLDGAPNPGPALGGLAFDPVSNTLFVADRATGMIHRFGLNGAEIGRYDHGVDGRKAAGLPAVAFDPANRLDIASPNFHSQDPASWGYAPPERRVFGLAVHAGRLYYAVADGLGVWSVAILPNGGFGADARIEVQVPPGDAPSEISKIVFDDRGAMILAERGAPTGAFDFLTLAQPATSRTLRYRLLQLDAAAPPTWQAEPDEYAIGFAAALRNANGGVAIGFGYRQDGSLDSGACGAFLWTTGEQLRAADDPAVAAQLAASGPLPLNGLQGNAVEAVRPDNVPPLQSYFANYFDDSGNPAFHGHLGDIAIPRGCARSALVLPMPVTAIPDWPGPSACPPDFTRFGSLCRPPRCPPGHGEGVQCCPRGTMPGANGECEPLRGGNLGCPIGAAPLRGPGDSIQCAWVARCPAGAQADLRGGCEQICPPGETAWRSRRCCGYGEVGLPDGRCCPERDVRDGKCVQACPEGAIRLPDGQCCPRQDVHDGKCVQACPEGAIRLPDGQCCPRQDVRDGKCVQACPEGAIRLPNGECCTREDVQNGKCVQACPGGAVRMPGGECCPRQDVRDGHCEHACNPGYHAENGRCVINCPAGEAPGADNLCHRIGAPFLCPPGLTPLNGACVNLRAPRGCGPGEIRRYDGRCVPAVPRRPEWRPRRPGGPYQEPYGRRPVYPPEGGANPWSPPGRTYREY